MKVGIITFHNAHNYGAMLQAYALQSSLTNLGHDVEIIDFRPDHENISQKKKTVALLKKLLVKLPKTIRKHVANGSLERYKAFDDFMNYNMNLSYESYINNEQLLLSPPRYDCYISGSDQVWNPEISGDNWSTYFLDFVKENKKKIAYATSFGSLEIAKENSSSYKKYLNKFDSISVREDNVLEFVGDMYNGKVIHTLDPTLLLNKEQWCKIAVIPKVKKYMLVYILEQTSEAISIVNRIAEKTGLEVINFSSNLRFTNEVMKATNAGPSEFLGFFANAELIITNSFHGTIFSIIFSKEFYSILPQKRSSRIVSLLNKLNLSNRIIELNSDLMTTNFEEKINYKNAFKFLDIEREKSMCFLRNI